jgi:hypothetical protein
VDAFLPRQEPLVLDEVDLFPFLADHALSGEAIDEFLLFLREVPAEEDLIGLEIIVLEDLYELRKGYKSGFELALFLRLRVYLVKIPRGIIAGRIASKDIDGRMVVFGISFI